MSKEFAIGEKVRVVAIPPYVKTAEPMPMLRPPEVIQLGEEGVVIDRRPGGYWAVRFAKGAFLVDSQYIEAVTAQQTHTEGIVASESELPLSEHLEQMPPNGN
jgi:hypothetical protein